MCEKIHNSLAKMIIDQCGQVSSNHMIRNIYRKILLFLANVCMPWQAVVGLKDLQ